MALSPRPARIIIINHVAEVGGAEESLLMLMRGLDRKAFEPLVLVPRAGPLVDTLQAMGIETRFVPLIRPKRTRSPWTLAQTAWRVIQTRRHVAQVAREWEATIIHANSSAAALQAPYLPDVPLIWHCRDLVRLGWVGRHIYARSTAVIAISDAVRRHLEGEVGNTAKIHLIYNGIDTGRFRPGPPSPQVRAELGANAGQFLIGMVAALVPWKGHDVFLRAAAQIGRRAPQARFVIVGADIMGDHPGYYDKLRACARDLGIEDIVAFTGHRADMPDVMRAIDILIHPAAGEPFGRVVAEAMSTAKPVIGANDAGPAEIIEDGVSGLLVSPGDSTAMADAALRLMADADLRTRMGRAARDRIVQYFSGEVHVQAVQRLYRALQR